MNRELRNTWSSPVRLAIGVGLTLCLFAPVQAQSLLTTNGNFFAWPDTEVPGLPGVYFAGTVDFATMSENNTLAFRADLYGVGTSGINSRALFTGANTATLQMLARWNASSRISELSTIISKMALRPRKPELEQCGQWPGL